MGNWTKPLASRGIIFILLTVWACMAAFWFWAINNLPEPIPETIKPAAPPIVEEVPEEIHAEAPTYSADELELLALVIYQEAGGDNCSDETRQMVGEVVLNRIESPYYPDTLHEVLTQRSQYGRLHWTGLVWPSRANLPQEWSAVKRAYECAANLLSNSVERLLPEDAVFQAEFEQGTETVIYSDGFYFGR